jgi:hypothetical protein
MKSIFTFISSASDLVAQRLENPDTRNREFRAIEEASKEVKIDQQSS